MSSLRSREVEIVPGNPFQHCKLDRKKYAEILTQIIENYSDGFVLSVNNKWGEGKTTFIKMWKVHLGNMGFKNVYFNAWEHDFGQDPMAAILSEIKSLELGNEAKLERIIKEAGRLSIYSIPIILKAFADKHIDTKSIKEGIQQLSEKAIDAFQSEVDEYAKKKKGLDDFKKALEEYVSSLEKPLVFIIDELDRCNPKYAVEVLEIIKHFFSVPGIVFVLSIDKEQLGNAVRGYFGSDLINADEYLRRFIDLEYSLPSPNIESFLKSIFEKLNFKEFFVVNKVKESNRFLHFAYWILSVKELSLRQIEKLFIQTRISVNTIKKENIFFPDTFFFLTYLKYHDNNIYKKIRNKEVIVQDIPRIFEEWFNKINIPKSNLDIDNFELIFILLYNRSRDDYSKLYNIGGSRLSMNFSPKITKFGNDKCVEILVEFENNLPKIYNIDYLLDKIDLVEFLEN